jgi:hypothetical protein
VLDNAVLVDGASPFAPSNCPTATSIGVNCNTSSAPCDILQPCENSGSCQNANSSSAGYTCFCTKNYRGRHCEEDHRPCKPGTCWDHGEYHMGLCIAIHVVSCTWAERPTRNALGFDCLFGNERGTNSQRTRTNREGGQREDRGQTRCGVATCVHDTPPFKCLR